MKVYHGSHIEIEDIDLSKSEKNKDFGHGFYVTKNRRHAEEWAKRMGEKQGTEGVVTEYEFGMYFFNEKDFKILRFDGYTEEWLDFVILNRTNRKDEQAHNYDFVKGPIAADRVTRRMYDYLDGIISKAKFLEELNFHEPTHQICLCTVKSLQLIRKRNRIIISKIEDISEEIILHLVLDEKLEEKAATDLFYNSATCHSLSDTQTNLYLKPWTEIYEMLKKENSE
jgi:hypothetical protein